MKRHIPWIIAGVLVLLTLYLVLTPWKYLGPGGVRVHRVTGVTQQLDNRGWVRLR